MQTQFNTNELDNRPDYAIESTNEEMDQEMDQRVDQGVDHDIDNAPDVEQEGLEKELEEGLDNGFDLDSFFAEGFEVPEINSHRKPKYSIPTDADFRVYKYNGKMFPSKEIVEHLKDFRMTISGTDMEVPVDLEYSHRDDNTFGIDVIDMRKLLRNEKAKFMAFGLTPRNEPKLDVFRSTKYDENDKAKSSIFTQGNSNDYLLEVIESVYGDDVWLDEEGNEKEYIELNLRFDREVPKPQNGKFMLLKETRKGDDTIMKPVYRKNTLIFAVEIVS